MEGEKRARKRGRQARRGFEDGLDAPDGKFDPFGKIPEFKYCAARVEAVDPAAKVAAE